MTGFAAISGVGGPGEVVGSSGVASAAAPPADFTGFDGGTPAAVGSDSLAGGTPASVGTDTIYGGNPAS